MLGSTGRTFMLIAAKLYHMTMILLAGLLACMHQSNVPLSCLLDRSGR
jgi:hypothetical protein